MVNSETKLPEKNNENKSNSSKSNNKKYKPFLSIVTEKVETLRRHYKKFYKDMKTHLKFDYYNAEGIVNSLFYVHPLKTVVIVKKFKKHRRIITKRIFYKLFYKTSLFDYFFFNYKFSKYFTLIKNFRLEYSHSYNKKLILDNLLRSSLLRSVLLKMHSAMFLIKTTRFSCFSPFRKFLNFTLYKTRTSLTESLSKYNYNIVDCDYISDLGTKILIFNKKDYLLKCKENIIRTDRHVALAHLINNIYTLPRVTSGTYDDLKKIRFFKTNISTKDTSFISKHDDLFERLPRFTSHFKNFFDGALKSYNINSGFSFLHYKEVNKLRSNNLSKVKSSQRRFLFEKLYKSYPYWKKKFHYDHYKTKKIKIDNISVIDSSYYYHQSLPYVGSFWLRSVKKRIFLLRRLFRKKNWKFTKLNKKRHFPRIFLRRSLSFGFFKRQDSFRLLHMFRTIFLKYSYGYNKKSLLIFFKNLKNSSIKNTNANNFLDRFIWNLERSANILIYRAKFSPNIKISNHLIRYGFFMLNNKLINNPYTQVSVFDILRVSRIKYFLRLFLRDYLIILGFRRFSTKVLYLELNTRVLALSVFRKPRFYDFILSKNVINPRPERFWYLSLPTVSSLF